MILIKPFSKHFPPIQRRRMAAATTSLREYQIPLKLKGKDLFKRKHRADSGAYAPEKQKYQTLKDIVNLITTQAATVTSYGSQVLSNILAVVPSTVHKNSKTFASSREARTGHAQKDEKHGTRLKCNHGVVIEKGPNDNGKLKEAAATNMSSSGKQLSNKPLALHDTPNHMAVADYVADIYKFYKDYERFDRPLDYIQHQVGITEDMRATVVDRIIAVHNKFALRPEALYLAIYIIDRYLSLERLHGRELKLVGISALYISSKYADMRTPQVLDFIDITDGAYSREEVLAMEKMILKSLHWKLTIPTQYMFLVQFLQTSKCDKEMECMVFFLAELGLMQYSTVKFSPSVAAASAVYAARWTLRKSPHWTETLKHHTGLSEIQLMDCAQILVKSHLDAPWSNLKVVYSKYSIEQFGAVALHPPAREILLRPMK